MGALLLKFLTPLTWLMFAIILVGMVDRVFLAPRGVALLPPDALDWLMLILMPLALAVWFGWKEKAKLKARAAASGAPDTRN